MIKRRNYYTFKIFKPFNNLIVAFSGKKLGNMSFSRGDRKQVISSQNKFFKELKINSQNVSIMDLKHSSKIKIVSRKDRSSFIKDTDGLISSDPNIFLMATFCDCLPIFFYDKKKNIIGLAHVGFLGTKKKLTYKMYKKFIQRFNSNPENLIIAFGPSLKKCCLDKNRKNDLDLISENLLQLRKIKKNNIEISDICTCCNKNFFSHRREGFKEGAHAALIGISR